MKRLIRDSSNQAYLVTDAPPPAPGQGLGAFSDERSAEQFLRRFVDAPLAMAALREVLLGEALPAHRMDPASLIRRLAGRLVVRGLRVLDPDRGAGEDKKAPGGGSGGTAAATEEQAEPATEEKKPQPEKKKTLTARWAPLEAYCADQVKLLGSATNMDPGTYASGTGTTAKAGKVAGLSATGQSSFTCEWRVKDVVFGGPQQPPKQDVQGKLAASGIVATAPQPLAVKRVPDRPLQPVSFSLSSGKYGWTAAFRVGVLKDSVLVQQALKVTPAWLGKWIEFDTEADGRSDWAFVKKDVTRWVFWDDETGAWAPLPRGISEYTINNMVFIQQGAGYVGREQDNYKWPEAFAGAAGFEEKKAAWLANIHQVWDDKFHLKHKECGSGADACCRWRLRFQVQYSAGSGDKDIFAVSAQEWERSNAKDWYLTEHRVGVAAHECGHLLGAYDEYEGGAVDTSSNKIEDASIMGADLTVAHTRHLDGLRDEVGKIINAAIGRSWTFEVK